MPASPPDRESLLRAAERQLTAAERTGDSTLLTHLLAPEFAGHDHTGRPTTRDSFIASFTAAGLCFESLETDSESFRLSGDTALVGGNSQWRVRLGDRTVDGAGRFLDVWVWRDAHWQLLAAAVTPQPV